ncbi:MAG: DUF4403 family protein [Bacteroidota bacterium]
MISTSRLAVLVRIPLPRLQIHVQAAVKQYLDEEQPALEAKEIRKTEVKLNGEVRLLQDQDYLITELPLKIETRVLPSLFGALGVLNLLDKISQIRFAIRLRLQTQLQVSPNGKLQASTEAKFFWEKKPMAGLVSLASVMGGLIESKLPDICFAIDMAIPQAVPLPDYEQEIWQSLHRWEQIENDPPLWFRVAPQQRETDRQLILRDNHLQAQVVLQAAPMVLLQKEDPPSADCPTLPNHYAPLGEALGQQNIHLESSLQALNQYLAEQRFQDENADLAVYSPQLIAQEGHWELRLELKGRLYKAPVSGDLSLFLEIDTSDAQPKLKLLKHELHTASLALRLALYWWSGDKLQTLLQTQLDQLLTDIGEAIQNAWATLSLPEPFLWQASAIEAVLSQASLSQESLSLDYEFSGTAEVILG